MNLPGVLRGRLDGVSDAWRGDHPWASFYDFMVEHESVGRPLWKAGGGTDLGLLYQAADEVGRLAPGSSVLDVPCGGGVALRGLQPGQDARYVAADISPAMLERTAANATRRGLGQVQCVEADVEHLPFPDDSFDLVVSFTGLHCFPRPGAAVAEIARVLKPGGVMTGSALLNDTGVRYAPMRFLGRAGGLLGPSGTRPELAHWLARSGFADAQIRTSGALAYFRGSLSSPDGTRT
jgi:SAM-dependent methyltransferase